MPLSLKAPMTTAVDDKLCNIFPNFRKNKVCCFMLPADDSHEVSCRICYFEKAEKFEIAVPWKL